jgi:hypothetical protein
MKNWGVYTVTLDDGDKIFFDYQGVNSMKDGVLAGGSNRWQITGGTGKLKAIKGTGTCKLTGNNDSLSYTCTGTYRTGSSEAKQ